MVEDQALAATMRELAQTMLTELPVDRMLEHLAAGIVGAVPRVMAGVALMGADGTVLQIAGSQDEARAFELLELELHEGPSHQAFATRGPVVVDLGDPTPFPAFAERARAIGLRGVAALPLQHHEQILGALDMFDLSGRGFDDSDVAAAQTLADVAAAYVLNAQTRSELEASAERLQAMVLHDALTSLPNRILFIQRLEHALRRAERSGNIVAVLFVDLDHFKAVNDLYGHAAGDDLLVAVARRISAVVRPGDTLARLSGDEFAVLCEELAGPVHVEMLAERISGQLHDPFVLDDTPHRVTASIGIAFGGLATRSDPAQLMRNADAAMYRAKRAGGNRHQVIDLRSRAVDDRSLRLHRDLASAARGEGLSLDFEPIHRAADGQLVAVEALLRWHHPFEGEVPATTLMALAAESGLMDQIGRWVLRTALESHGRWRAPAPGVSINVAPSELLGHHYVALVTQLIRDAGCDPTAITFEVTEDAFVADPERALVVLRELHELGVRIALDDFGTGYSSLTHLHRFPVDVVKIDGNLVASVGSAAGDRVVTAIIDLAHNLDLTVVAEGVDSTAQHRWLRKHRCDLVQGFSVGAPRPAAAIDDLH